MKPIMWSKKKVIITTIICAIIAISTITALQLYPTTQAAIIDPHPGLVGWWRFDEGSGTVTSDSSGYGNGGTISGIPVWLDGKYGKSISFDGVSNYVAIPDSPALKVTGSITLEAWVKTSNTNKQAVITKSGSYLLYIGTGGDGRVYSYLYGTTSGWKNGLKNIADGNWHYIALTYDPSAGANNFKLFVDGVLDAQYTVTGNISPTTNRLGIGDRPDAGFRDFFNGVIDETHIYNRALSITEIQTDFQKDPDFSANVLAKVPKGTTQVIITLSWQGSGSINATIVSPSQTYTEDIIPVYCKTSYTTTDGTSGMLNIKRLLVSVNALSTDQNWNVRLTNDGINDYQISVEVQK